MTTILIVARYHKTDHEFLAQLSVDKAPPTIKMIQDCRTLFCYSMLYRSIIKTFKVVFIKRSSLLHNCISYGLNGP
jgi:hypothetical protein